MKKILAFALVLACASAGVVSAAEIPDNPVWLRPVILPMPDAVPGEIKPVVSLAGTWKINLKPPENFWTNDVDPGSWSDVRVPGQTSRQGFGGRGGGGSGPVPYAYKTRLDIPADFAGRKIIVQFQGVTGTATVWVNGQPIGKPHVGGFTLWDADITDAVKIGGDNWLTVQVKEGTNSDSSVGARYPGGIIRNLYLVALPKDHFTRFNVETDFDVAYENATLKAWIGATVSGDATVEFTLTAPDGSSVGLSPARIKLSAARAETIADIPVAAPLKWDAEHPHLYTLKATLLQGGKRIETISKKIGFRKVVVDGRRLLVNGREVKLRGAGQFDSDALLGRTLPPGEAEEDVKLYKAANMNYARPAVYPANVEFLDACDRYGLYVECECPCWNSGTPDMTPIYLSQTAEMLEAYRTHPSIIMWNLANETGYSINIRRMGEYIRAEDATRPRVFSWSHSVARGDPLPYEIYSYHYPDWDTDLGKPGVAVFNGRLQIPVPEMPVLADEFAHPAAYDNEERNRDPNVRAFWGESIKRFWERMFTTEGSLGGGIWGFDDDPRSSSQDVYGWGIVDVWRRPKPEFWMARKAYAPVQLEDKPVYNPGPGNPLVLPIRNWFDQTNLNEVKVSWRVRDETGEMTGPAVPPHGQGILTIPARQWKSGDVVEIRFLAADGLAINEFAIAVDPPPVVLPVARGPAPRVEDRADGIVVTGHDFAIIFNKRTGSITDGMFKGTHLIKGGPYLHLIGADISDWSLGRIEVKIQADEAIVNIAGSYSVRAEAVNAHGHQEEPQPTAVPTTLAVRFEVHIDGSGRMLTNYTLGKFDLESPAKRLHPWSNTSVGGYQEVGITYALSKEIDRFTWQRAGLWSVYPDDHIARNQGMAVRRGMTPKIDEKPAWTYARDETPPGVGANDFRSQKENIYFATAAISDVKLGIRAESAGTDAVRLEVADPSQADSEVLMHINSRWNYRHLGLGNYMKPPVIVKDGYSSFASLRLVESSQ